MIRKILNILKPKSTGSNIKNKEELIIAIESLRDFFSIHKVHAWQSRCDILLEKLANDDRNLKSAIKNFAGQGMGSLLDLYISGRDLNGMTAAEVNQKLDFLIEKFYSAVKNV